MIYIYSMIEDMLYIIYKVWYKIYYMYNTCIHIARRL